MRTERVNSIDDYECFLGAAVETWSPQQRTALAAALAERWLPVYEKFSQAEQWGDPPSLRRSLEAIWSHVGGRTLTSADAARHLAQLHDSTPHMDDFEAPEALAACIILGHALKCCKTAANLPDTVQAALSCFEAVLPDWAFEPDEQPRLWKQVAARKELKKQLKLIEQIGAETHFDNLTIDALRRRLISAELRGEPPSRPDSSCGPTAITNQQAFEQYRRMVESDLRTQGPIHLPGVSSALLIVGVWGGRYSRRRQTINGEYGRLADVAAQHALVARQRALDAVEREIPDWDPDARMMIEMCFGNPFAGYDVKSPWEPHGYGPSLRRLWFEAKRSGRSNDEAWEAVVAWARHRPAAWSVEDQRKKKGQAHTTLELGSHLTREVTWTNTNDVAHPWAAEADGPAWQVRLNDFPDDFMYTLIVDGQEIGSFHDWPETWRRD